MQAQPSPIPDLTKRYPDTPNMCGAADMSPRMVGHKCIKDRHPRSEKHVCRCTHEWMESVEPDAH